MKLVVLSGEDLRAALPMPEAVEAMKEAFIEYSTGRAAVPPRLSIPVPESVGTVLIMPARLACGLGAKLVSVFPRNPERGRPAISGLMVLLDPETGEPLALLDGAGLTAWRTGAAAAAATDLLARREVRVAAIFGAGAQARTQALGVDAVRDLEEIRVFSPREASRDAFVEEMAPLLRARLVSVESPAAAIAGAEVVSAATSSQTPVFDGRLLETGAHVNGMGSFSLETRELDDDTVGRASVFVDSRSAALAEAGDLVMASGEGRTDLLDWTEIGEVAAGIRPGRQSADDVTLFKSVGLAVQDVKAAVRALERANAAGLGTEVEI